MSRGASDAPITPTSLHARNCRMLLSIALDYKPFAAARNLRIAVPQASFPAARKVVPGYLGPNVLNGYHGDAAGIVALTCFTPVDRHAGTAV